MRISLVRPFIALSVFAAGSLAPATPVRAATITVAYEVGHRDVLINDYGTPALGTFRLRDGDSNHVALCIEAHQSHTTASDAYAPVTNRIDSPELDALLWWLGGNTGLDDDTATAAAALAWYYADAQRNIGVPVWSNGARGFARIGPTSPEPWDALPQFTRAHPVGLRSGSRNLDGAERRVVELHRMATALAGPWSLVSDAASRRVQLSGAAGPLAGQHVTFTISTPGGTSSVVAVTDGNGWAAPVLPELPDGATVMASVLAPGVHREWDGGGIQRMVTTTSVEITTSFAIQALPRFVVVQKRSSDPSIGVEGGEFELLDGSGSVVGTARTGADGRAEFAAFDPVLHPAPYAIRERTAPPGLSPIASDVAVPTASHDPTQPTVVEIVDEPARAAVRVRKLFSEPTGPPDRSGFAFAVSRSDAGFTGQLVTGPDGVTETLLVPLGRYRVCETSTPQWAVGLIDGGCLDVTITLEHVSSAQTLTFDYVNIVPTTTTTTTTTTTSTTSTTTLAPTTTPPAPSTAVTTPASSPVVDSTTTTSVANLPAPPVTTPPSLVPRPLPRTGGDGAARLLDLADIGFVVGIALVAAAALLPRRERETAGR